MVVSLRQQGACVVLHSSRLTAAAAAAAAATPTPAPAPAPTPAEETHGDHHHAAHAAVGTEPTSPATATATALLHAAAVNAGYVRALRRHLQLTSAELALVQEGCALHSLRLDKLEVSESFAVSLPTYL